MEQGEILSLKKRIEDAASKPTEWPDLASELIAEWKRLPRALQDAFISRIEDPNTFTGSPLITDILILAKKIKNPRLFKAAFKSGLKNRLSENDLIRLFENGVNVGDMEQILLDRIENAISTKSYLDLPFLKERLTALQKCGSIDCLTDLIRLEFDHRKWLKAAKNEAIEEDDPVKKGINSLTARVVQSNHELFEDTIHAITDRQLQKDDEWLLELGEAEALFSEALKIDTGASKKKFEWVQAVDQILQAPVETVHTEFKETFLGRGTEIDKKLKSYYQKSANFRVAKTIASFANTEGGQLFIGIKDKKESGQPREVIGIEVDFPATGGDLDGYQEKLNQVLAVRLQPSDFGYSYKFHQIEDKVVCEIFVPPQKPGEEVWVKWNTDPRKTGGRTEDSRSFFRRLAGETVELEGTELIYYLKTRGSLPSGKSNDSD